MTISSYAAVLADSDHWDRPGWWPVFPFLWLVLIVSVIALVAFRSRQWRRLAGTQQGESRLAERYAAGEIDEQEYRSRLAVLREKS